MNLGDTWIAVTGLVLSFLVTGVVRKCALRKNLLDVPNLRSSHGSPTPRGGGIAIVVAFFLSSVFLVVVRAMDIRLALALWIGGGLMATVGFVDDWKPQSALVRLGVHLAASIFVVVLFAEGAIREFGVEETIALWFYFPIAVISLAWVSNLFNFMDGIDGIASSEAIFIMTAAAWLTWDSGGNQGLTIAMVCLACATLGFAFWNWPPATIFMGDVGSGFLGFVIGVFALYAGQNGGVSLIVWAILGGAFLTDATVTLLRRMLRGDRWADAHRTHAYQHLAQRWKAHLPVTMVLSVINVFWLLPLAYLATRTPNRELFLLGIAEIPLVGLALLLGAGRPPG